MNENTNIMTTETTTATATEATNVTADTCTAADPATAVAEGNTGNAATGFIAAHKSTLIKGALTVGIVATAGFLARHIVKKHKNADVVFDAEPEVTVLPAEPAPEQEQQDEQQK